MQRTAPSKSKTVSSILRVSACVLALMAGAAFSHAQAVTAGSAQLALFGESPSLILPPDIDAAPLSDPADAVCARFAAGSVINSPAELTSQNGVLEVTFHFRTAVDEQGLSRYCYVTDAGSESPTLRVNPGDQLILHFENDLPSAAASSAHMAGMVMRPNQNTASAQSSDCDAQTVNSSSTNLHFHGLNVSPACHQDEVIHTIVQPQQTFDYTVQIPQNEPAGLYWYHPHPHGFSESQVIGGASGAIIVQGIQNFNPALAGLPERVLVLRDQILTATEKAESGPVKPATDFSLNFVPINYPNYTPAVIQTGPGIREFWRFANTSADTVANLQLMYGGVPQSLQVYAIDGVPLTDSSGNPRSNAQTSALLPPGARVEFVITTPAVGLTAQLVTQTWNNGNNFDIDPGRPIANIVSSERGDSLPSAIKLPEVTQSLPVARFAALSEATPSTSRKLFFSVKADFSEFYLTIDGQTPAPFSMDGPPSIVLHSGTVEQWTVENRSPMDHAFHIHQIHFQTLAVNGQPVSDPTLRDTLDVPHWSGSGPYPSVTLLMDFRDPGIVGTFVYHCHVLSHEDRGMMAAIQVLPAFTTTTVSASPATAVLGSTVAISAAVNTASGAPTGTVTFYNGATVLGTAALNASDVAGISVNTLAVGTNSITAVYSGDSSYLTSTSASVSVAVAASVPAPLITSISPSSGAEDSVVTLIGTSFGASQRTSIVTFNGTPAAVSGWTNSAITTLVPPGTTTGSVVVTVSGQASNGVAFTVLPLSSGLQFITTTPCRIVDTRLPNGAFGSPAINAGESRSFPIPQSACGIPPTALAYSVNVTVVPISKLDYLTMWPSGQQLPNVSTLNSDGRIKANAAIVPAGTGGAVTVFASDTTNFILDINGYFEPAASSSGLSFYPLPPCRVADTRLAAGPFLAAGTSRSFPVQSSPCNIPSNAAAYSLNFTVVPRTTLNYLTVWPTGQGVPNVSTLNAGTGAVTANAAIVPAGSGGTVSVFATDDTDVILDVNGYFASPGPGGLSLYPVTPCRVIDSRPALINGSLELNVQGSTCAPPAAAQAYVLNATALPSGSLNHLTFWPDGTSQPGVSTLNALDGAVTSNMAVVPAANGMVDVFASDGTSLIVDLSNYFAP